MNDQLMLEYVFFHQQPFDEFLLFLESMQVEPLKHGVEHSDVEGLIVYLQDDLDDELSDRIERYYDEMMRLNEQLVAGEEAKEDSSQVGVAVSVADGRSVLASVEPEILNRILTVISHQQLGELVDAIVDAVENPDDRPLCKR